MAIRLDRDFLNRNRNPKGKTMRALALLPLVAVAACANGQLLRPSEIAANSQVQARIAQFCAADFVESNTATLGEYVGIYNLVAPLLDREPIATASLTESEAVQALLVVRSGVCLATLPAPAPATVEAVQEAEIVAVDGELAVVAE